MKVLVTGLCLSRNLGGPAMGLCLARELKQRFDGVEISFAVTATSFEEELEQSRHYGYPVVRRDRLHVHLLNRLGILSLMRFFTYKGRKLADYIPSSAFWREVHREFIDAIRDSDVVIDMNGISYVGDGSRHFYEGIEYYTNFHYCRAQKRPFARFIQSFGPFLDWSVRFFARREFKALPFIPARGKISASYCREIVSDPSRVHDFPDLAITLPPAEAGWVQDYLQNKGLTPGEYVVLSPSSVITNIVGKGSQAAREEHSECFHRLASHFIAQGRQVLFLPHMYSRNPMDCDGVICEHIVKALRGDNDLAASLHLVEETLDPMQAKSLIAASELAVVSRYHALVAALSTQTPVVALGWNDKYQDILDYYALGDMAIDARSNSSDAVFDFVLEKAAFYSSADFDRSAYQKYQQQNLDRVGVALDMLESWIREQVSTP